MDERKCDYCPLAAVWTIYRKWICESPECRKLAEADYNPSAHRTPRSCLGG